MRQNDFLRLIPNNFTQYIGTVIIAQMTAVIDDTLFDIYRTGCLHQHLNVMIAFKHIVIRIHQIRLYLVFDITGIRHIHHLFLTASNHIPYRVFTVMRHRKHGDFKSTAGKRIKRFDMLKVIGFHILCRIRRNIAKHTDLRYVILMRMGDQQRIGS